MHAELLEQLPRSINPGVVRAGGHAAHRHTFHQFLFVPLGHARIWACGDSHLLSPECGLWIPAGTWHSARFDADCLIEPICFDADRWAMPLPTVTPITITTTRHRMLLAHLRVRTEPDDALLSALMSGPGLPLLEPRTAAAVAIAAALRADPADQRTVAQWASHHHVGATTLRRAFVNETGLNFSEWRTRLRLNLSMELLAGSDLVSSVAHRVGFTSTNGFIIAFRRHFGTTPGAYAETRLLAG